MFGYCSQVLRGRWSEGLRTGHVAAGDGGTRARGHRGTHRRSGGLLCRPVQGGQPLRA